MANVCQSAIGVILPKAGLDQAAREVTMSLEFAVDLITFYHPDFWKLPSRDEVKVFAREHPKAFWDRLLDSAQASGVTGIELTFSPFNWQDAVRTYGSVDDFAQQLSSRHLSIASGFFADFPDGRDLTDATIQAGVIERAALYAEFLKTCGAGALVLGLPMRKSPLAPDAFFVDLAYVSTLASFLNRLGKAVLERGIKLAIHTEAHSVFSTPRDVDLFLTLTDPTYVSFCPDTAHLVLTGADPIEVVHRHQDRVLIAHWKDAVGPMPADTPIDEQIHQRHKPYFCRLGTGRVDWFAWIRLLRDAKYSGWAVLELDAIADPVAEIIGSRKFVEQALLPTL
jgi:sugar phosphate isomerase/epimerase